jgi:hypothetical protein
VFGAADLSRLPYRDEVDSVLRSLEADDERAERNNGGEQADRDQGKKKLGHENASRLLFRKKSRALTSVNVGTLAAN